MRLRRNTDEDQRRLERAAPGDPRAYLQLLRDRLRSGRTSLDRLKMAVILGDEAAAIVTGLDSEWYKGKFPPNIAYWPALEESEMRTTLNKVIYVDSPSDPHQISIEGFADIMTQVVGLMRLWVDRQTPEERQHLFTVAHMVQHLTTIEGRITRIKNLVRWAWEQAPRCQRCKGIAVGYSTNRSRAIWLCQAHAFKKRKFVKHLLLADKSEFLTAMYDLWRSYGPIIRYLAQRHTPNLTTQSFGEWHLEFLQALLPWTLGQ